MNKYDGELLNDGLFDEKEQEVEQLPHMHPEFKKMCKQQNHRIHVQRRTALDRLLIARGHEPVDPSVGITDKHRMLYKLYTKKEYRG